MLKSVSIVFPLVRRLCIKTSAEDGRILYNPNYLLRKSDEYFRAKDIGQCCEKEYRAAELTLIQYVKDVEFFNGISIAPNENSWNRFMLEKLVTIIANSCVGPTDKKLFISGWNQAKIFHIDGWQLNNLTVDYVELGQEHVKDFIDAVNSVER